MSRISDNWADTRYVCTFMRQRWGIGASPIKYVCVTNNKKVLLSNFKLLLATMLIKRANMMLLCSYNVHVHVHFLTYILAQVN